MSKKLSQAGHFCHFLGKCYPLLGGSVISVKTLIYTCELIIQPLLMAKANLSLNLCSLGDASPAPERGLICWLAAAQGKHEVLFP